jgi:hypothetical protein
MVPYLSRNAPFPAGSPYVLLSNIGIGARQSLILTPQFTSAARTMGSTTPSAAMGVGGILVQFAFGRGIAAWLLAAGVGSLGPNTSRSENTKPRGRLGRPRHGE